MENESSTDDYKLTHEEEKNEIGDKLEILFKKQKALISQELDVSDENNQIRENKMKRLYQVHEPFKGYRIFMLSSALLHEAVELQRETDWKWWKSDKGIDNQKVIEEMVDLWHFLIQLSIEAGLTPDILITKYMEKNKENTKRQESGY